jgi:hypothetical protein
MSSSGRYNSFLYRVYLPVTKSTNTKCYFSQALPTKKDVALLGPFANNA